MASSHSLYYNSLYINIIVHSYFACINIHSFYHVLSFFKWGKKYVIFTCVCDYIITNYWILLILCQNRVTSFKIFVFLKLGFSLFQKNYWNISKSDISIILWYFPVTFLCILFFLRKNKLRKTRTAKTFPSYVWVIWVKIFPFIFW